MRKDRFFTNPEYWLFLLSAMSLVVVQSWLSHRESGSASLDTQKFILDSILGIISYSVAWAFRQTIFTGKELKDSFLISLLGTFIYTCGIFSQHSISYLFRYFSKENLVAIIVSFILSISVYTILITIIYYGVRDLLIKRFR
jgi:hypothetical protein